MICTNNTEKECLDRGLFGDREWRIQYLRAVRKGNIGFLLNVSSNELLGIFAAEGPAQLNINPDAWRGNFPAQIKVKPLGKLQRIAEATDNYVIEHIN
jgi:hypothetical protein